MKKEIMLLLIMIILIIGLIIVIKIKPNKTLKAIPIKEQVTMDSYPFYKIIESREIACLRLTPAWSYAERIKDGIKYDNLIMKITNHNI